MGRSSEGRSGKVMRRSLRIWLAVLTVAVGTALPSAAGAETLRSGRIVGGIVWTAESDAWNHKCSEMPDCQAWLRSGCDAALTGVDPAWLTSIVDVGDLADGTSYRLFEYSSVWAWVYIQFWRADCTEIRDSERESPTPDRVRFPIIPSGAKWMTVTGNAGVNIHWTLSAITQPSRAVPGPGGTTPAPRGDRSPPATRTFYFAEGTTRAGFAEYLDLLNPTTTGGTARVTYVFADGGSPLERDYTVGPGRTRGIDVAAEVGMGRDVSMRVETPLDWVAERPMYFTANGWTGGHDQVGTASPLTTWNFAEGTTLPGFEEFLTLHNPDPADAAVTIQYLTEGCTAGGNAARSFTVAGQSRHTVRVNAAPGPANPGGLGQVCTGVSSVVRSTNGVAIVAERPLYFIRDFGAGTADDGHDVFGVPEAALEWAFAEGTTLAGFHQFLTLANPGDAAASVTLAYQTESDGRPLRSLTVEPRSRRTVQVFSDTDPGGIGPGVSGASVTVTSNRPILAERPLYVVRDFGDGIVASGGHAAQGSTRAGTRFSFASGSTERWMASFVTIQNGGASPATVTLTYYTPSGPAPARSLTVAGGTRATVRIDDSGPAALGSDHQGPVGLLVESDRPVLVERPSYFNRSGADGASTVSGDMG